MIFDFLKSEMLIFLLIMDDSVYKEIILLFFYFYLDGIIFDLDYMGFSSCVYVVWYSGWYDVVWYGVVLCSVVLCVVVYCGVD